MVKELFVSFWSNLKSKSANPFFGTYAIVWGIRNWRLVYSIFNFDEKTPLDKKIEIISSYFSLESFFYDLLINVLWTFFALVISYSVVNLSRLIINFYENVITPKIYELTNKGSVVLKSDYEKLLQEQRFLEGKIEKEREAKVRANNEIERLEKLLDDRMKKDNIDQENESSGSFDSYGFSKEVNLLFDKIYYKNLVEEFVKTVQNAQNKRVLLTKNKNIEYFFDLGLITMSTASKSSDYEDVYIELTTIGLEVLRRARLEIT